MELGWKIALETEGGVVGLWTSWLGSGFELFYPLGVEIPDEIIMETLDVSLAKSEKDEMCGKRSWGKYYSKRLKDYGRVWIEQSSQYMYGRTLYTIEDCNLVENYFGHSCSNTICTYNFHHSSESAPDAPNCSSRNIKEYKEKFINLLVKIANIVGKIKAVNLDSGLVLYTPELLEEEGYKVVRMHSQNEFSPKICYTQDQKNNIEIMLRSGNSIVPWVTVIRYPVTDLTAQDLTDLVNKHENFENSCNLFPLFDYLSKQAEIYSK